jgi:low affinity Fe/Cu permease
MPHSTGQESLNRTQEGLLRHAFRRFSQWVSRAAGTPWAFCAALLLIIVWALCGPMFHYSDTWQLVINTGTTIITFLMVFIIQNTQNRDGKAIQLKLDELIRTQTEARNRLIDLEDWNDADLDKLQKQFVRIRHRRQEQAENDAPPPSEK